MADSTATTAPTPMAFKTYAKKEDVPAALLADYVEKDGKWVPQIEGAGDDGADKAKVAQMRDKNIELERQLQETKTALGRFSGLDPTKANEALGRLREMQEDAELAALLGDKPDAKTVKAAAEKLAQTRAKALIDEREAQLNAVNAAKAATDKQNAEMRERFGTTLLSTSLGETASKLGVKFARGAMEFAKVAAAKHWTVGDDFGLKSRDLFDKDGKPVVSMEAYVPMLMKEHPLLFESASGGGAGGPGTTPGQQGPKGVVADPSAPGLAMLSAKP